MSPLLPIRVHRLRWLALLFALHLLPGSVAAAPAPDATGGFYDPESVQTIHLQIKSEDLNRLQRALPRRICVPCTFRWNDQTLQNVCENGVASRISLISADE